MDKIKDIHRIAKEIKGLAFFVSRVPQPENLVTIRRLSGKIILICEDLEEEKESNVNERKK